MSVTPLPQPRGPLSAAVLAVLTGSRSAAELPRPAPTDPYGEDHQLALYSCYELHYRGFDGVEDELEWDPDLVRFRAALERPFLAALRAEVAGGEDVEAVIGALLVEPVQGSGPSYHLLRAGQLWQLREYVVHRSLYHLKEADPQAWVIPRLSGQAKASLVSVEHDEYGAGRAEAMHAQLFAEMMSGLDLDPRYGRYLDNAPAITLSVVNLMSLFGLHRALRGALVGQFADVEIASSPGSARLVKAIERLGGGAAGVRFYSEHVEADAVHEQLVRHGIIADLLRHEPQLGRDVVFGIQASELLEERLGRHLVGAWESSRSSLRTPLPDAQPST